MYPKILPEVRGGAQRAEGSVVEGKLPILLPFLFEMRVVSLCLLFCFGKQIA